MAFFNGLLGDVRLLDRQIAWRTLRPSFLDHGGSFDDSEPEFLKIPLLRREKSLLEAQVCPQRLVVDHLARLDLDLTQSARFTTGVGDRLALAVLRGIAILFFALQAAES